MGNVKTPDTTANQTGITYHRSPEELSLQVNGKIQLTSRPRKIMLFNPPRGLPLGAVEKPMAGMQPLGLAYIAAACEAAGHEVKVCDAYSFGYDKDYIREYLEVENPEVVASTATTPYVNSAWIINEIAKEINPDVLTIIGGAHASLVPEDVVSNLATDIAVVGEGEHIMNQIMDHLDDHDFENISGIVFRSDNTAEAKVHRTKDREVNYNLDLLPFPARHLFPDLSLYEVAPHWAKDGLFAPINTSRGCPFSCEFCSITKYQGTKFRYRSPENIIDELRMLKEKYNVSTFSIRDGVATLNKDRMIELCELMIKENLNMGWSCTSIITSADVGMFAVMKKAGCFSIQYGIETGSDEILDKNPYLKRKNKSIEKVEKAIRMTVEAGIDVHGYFIVGLPGETKESVEKTIQFAKRLPIGTAGFTIARPVPGTSLYDYYESRGRLLTKVWYKYDTYFSIVIDHETLTHKELMTLNRKCWRRFYLRPRIVWNRLKRIHSFAALKTHLDIAFRFIIQRAEKSFS